MIYARLCVGNSILKATVLRSGTPSRRLKGIKAGIAGVTVIWEGVPDKRLTITTPFSLYPVCSLVLLPSAVDDRPSPDEDSLTLDSELLQQHRTDWDRK